MLTRNCMYKKNHLSTVKTYDTVFNIKYVADLLIN